RGTLGDLFATPVVDVEGVLCETPRDLTATSNSRPTCTGLDNCISPTEPQNSKTPTMLTNLVVNPILALRSGVGGDKVNR
ncbi:hypothetical protein B0T09DRAFT_271200, partial [Sordaria sp. MPI-SDFR-AT-0083]